MELSGGGGYEAGPDGRAGRHASARRLVEEPGAASRSASGLSASGRIAGDLSVWALIAALVSVAGCTSDRTAFRELAPKAERFAVEFAAQLSKGNYNNAYKLASTDLREEMTLEQMQEGFERIIPFEIGADREVALDRVIPDWTGRRLGDIVWVYVTVSDENVNDIVSLVVTFEGGELRVRSLEFGRL